MRAYRSKDTQNALHGITAEELARILGVHITTARRYKRGESPSEAAMLVIKLKTTGDLGLLDPAFAGWHLKNGQIVAPDGTGYGPGEILSTTYWRALARHYQAENRLPRQADWVDEKWSEAKVVDDAV